MFFSTKRLGIKLFTIIQLLVFQNTYAQWVKSNPFEGSYVTSSISLDNTLMVGTNTGGIFFSNNSGESWIASSGTSSYSITSFTLIEDKVFVGTHGGGILTSIDNGVSWSNASIGLTTLFVKTIASIDNYLLAGIEDCFGCSDGGIFISSNNGISWTLKNNEIPTHNLRAMVVQGSHVFVGTYGDGVFRSSDGGTSWVTVNAGLTKQVYSLAVHENTLYATTQEGIFVSEDNGDSWRAINNGISTNMGTVNPIHRITTNGEYLFATEPFNVYRSPNNGESWSIVNLYGLNDVETLFIHGDKVFAGAPSGLFSHTLHSFPSILSISPMAGTIGSTVILKGRGFSTNPLDNTIILGGGVTTKAQVSSNDSLVFIVPPNTLSGPLSVGVVDEYTIPTDSFEIIPDITFFTPASGPPRTSLRLLGTGFSSFPLENLVTIDGRPAWVFEIHSDGLTVIVPDSVFTSNISITVKGHTAISSAPFVVTPPSPLPDPGGSGNITWTQPIRAGFKCNAMTVDSRNDLFFSGALANDFGNDPNYFKDTSLPKSGSYLIKSDSSYNVKWKKVVNGVSTYKIQIDSEDNLIWVAFFLQSITIDSQKIQIPEFIKHGIIIAKFNGVSGDMMWFNIIKSDSPYTVIVSDLKIDPSDGIYLAGMGNSSWTFFNGLEVAGSINGGINSQFFGYFARYSNSGEFEWVKSFTDGYSIWIKSIEIDSLNNIYVTGSWAGMGTFESIPKASPSEDIIIAKFDSQRQLVWFKQIGAYYNDTSESGNAIALDEKLNSLYVTGSFVRGNFGSGELLAEDHHIFLARYTLDGNMTWVKKMGSWSGSASNTEEGSKLMVDQDGFIYLGGTIGHFPTNLGFGFDGISLGAYEDTSNSNLYDDGFVAKYTATGTLLWAQHFGDPNYDDYLTDFKKDNKNNLFLSGVAGTWAIYGEYLHPYMSLNGFVCKIKNQTEDLFELSNSNIQFDAETNLTKSFQIITNQRWSLSNNDTWFSISSLTGDGNYELILNAQTNYANERYGIVTAKSDNGIIKEINVQQFKSDNSPITSVSNGGSDSHFIIYPNPSMDVLNIHTNESILGLIEITDVTGKRIANLTIKNNSVDVKSLPPGLYFLKIVTSERQSVKRFIKL